jgi:hypothetical protein
MIQPMFKSQITNFNPVSYNQPNQYTLSSHHLNKLTIG